MKKTTKTSGSETSSEAGSEDNKKKPLSTVKSRRKNSNESTRTAGRQRSGSNGPQQGSH